MLLEEYLLNQPYAFNQNANYLYTAAQCRQVITASVCAGCVFDGKIEKGREERIEQSREPVVKDSWKDSGC